MRQRAALLRTCLAPAGGTAENGRVILLDEPFSALDAITRARMRRWYQGIAATMRLSTILITHDVEEAVFLADEVDILNGRPARITRIFKILPPRPRREDFLFSPEGARQKQAILAAIDNSEDAK
jgi:ABC-type nitrate/sulfonate/bicarbonate transport system ATPase subunit